MGKIIQRRQHGRSGILISNLHHNIFGGYVLAVVVGYLPDGIAGLPFLFGRESAVFLRLGSGSAVFLNLSSKSTFFTARWRIHPF